MRFPIMIRAMLSGSAAAVLAALAGCATSPLPPEAETKPPEVERQESSVPKDARDMLPSQQTERRIEAYARFAAGVSYELKEEPEKALDEFYKAATADSANEFLVLDVTRRLLRNSDSKQIDRAEILLSKAVRELGASARLMALHGVVLLQAGKKEQAIAANRAAIKKQPEMLQAYQNLVQIYLEAKQPKAALQVMDEAAKHITSGADSLISLAELLGAYYRHQPQEGDAIKPRMVRLLDQAESLQSKNPVLRLRLADAYRVAGALDKATKLYLGLAEQEPNLPGLREKLTDVYISSGDRKKAAEQLEAIVRDNPSNAKAYLFLGSLAADAKKYNDAADYLQKALLFQPDLPAEVYYTLTGIQINTDKPETALQTLAKVREKFPVRFVTEFYTGLAYSRMKQYAQAVKSLTAAELQARTSETNQLTDDLYFQLGATHERNKDYEQAENYFTKCLKLSPDNAAALNYLGYMWAERGVKLQEAHQMIEKAVKLEPKSSAYLDSLAWVLFKLNQPKEALRYILEAVKLSEEPDATLYDHLGDIYGALQQHDQAREAWQKSVAIEPNQAIKKKLEASNPKGISSP